jgi:tRNA dimethylallyltransferase
MRRAGLVEEVRAALAGPGLGRTARQAIGYQEVADVLEAGAEPDAAVFETVIRRTRSFARRQRMWFRRDPRVTWYGTDGNPCLALPALLAAWRS